MTATDPPGRYPNPSPKDRILTNFIDLQLLQGLVTIRLIGCSNMITLPACVNDLACLEDLYICSCRHMERIAPQVFPLPVLTNLIIEDCPRLTHLPPSLGLNPALVCLTLSDCPKAVLPDEIAFLHKLQVLSLCAVPFTFHFPSTLGFFSRRVIIRAHIWPNSLVPPIKPFIQIIREMRLHCDTLPWTAARHPYFSQQFQNSLGTLLLCLQRNNATLPVEIRDHVLSYCFVSMFPR